jgi:hypothetical protein
MGPVGLAAVAVGGVVYFSGHRAIVASILDLPEPLARAAEQRLAPLERAAIVVFIAVAVYLVARQLGHGRVGLYACVTLLMVNAAVVAALRARWFLALDAEPAIAARHRRGAFLQMAGAWVGFAGCAIYLLRP